jgi:hypothetical protein
VVFQHPTTISLREQWIATYDRLVEILEESINMPLLNRGIGDGIRDVSNTFGFSNIGQFSPINIIQDDQIT